MNSTLEFHVCLTNRATAALVVDSANDFAPLPAEFILRDTVSVRVYLYERDPTTGNLLPRNPDAGVTMTLGAKRTDQVVSSPTLLFSLATTTVEEYTPGFNRYIGTLSLNTAEFIAAFTTTSPIALTGEIELSGAGFRRTIAQFSSLGIYDVVRGAEPPPTAGSPPYPAAPAADTVVASNTAGTAFELRTFASLWARILTYAGSFATTTTAGAVPGLGGTAPANAATVGQLDARVASTLERAGLICDGSSNGATATLPSNDVSGDFTALCFFRRSRSGVSEVILKRGGDADFQARDYQFDFLSDGRASFSLFGTNGATLNSPSSVGAVGCLAARRSGNALTLWVNGVQVASTTLSGFTPSATSFTLTLGGWNGGTFPLRFSGLIARAALLNFALTDAEILDLATNRLGVLPVELQRGEFIARTAGSFVVGYRYRIVSVGTTSFTAIGAASNTVGVEFTATGVGTGTGTALQLGSLYTQPDSDQGAGPVLRGNYGLPDTILPADGHTAGGVFRPTPLLSGPIDIEAAIDGASGNVFVLGSDVQRIPPGWAVTGVRVFTPTGQGAANITLGTSSGGTQICGSTAVSANAFVTATLTAAQPIFAAGTRLFLNRSATLNAGSRLILTIAPVAP